MFFKHKDLEFNSITVRPSPMTCWKQGRYVQGFKDLSCSVPVLEPFPKHLHGDIVEERILGEIDLSSDPI